VRPFAPASAEETGGHSSHLDHTLTVNAVRIRALFCAVSAADEASGGVFLFFGWFFFGVFFVFFVFGFFCYSSSSSIGTQTSRPLYA